MEHPNRNSAFNTSYEERETDVEDLRRFLHARLSLRNLGSSSGSGGVSLVQNPVEDVAAAAATVQQQQQNRFMNAVPISNTIDTQVEHESSNRFLTQQVTLSSMEKSNNQYYPIWDVETTRFFQERESLVDDRQSLVHSQLKFTSLGSGSCTGDVSPVQNPIQEDDNAAVASTVQQEQTQFMNAVPISTTTMTTETQLEQGSDRLLTQEGFGGARQCHRCDNQHHSLNREEVMIVNPGISEDPFVVNPSVGNPSGVAVGWDYFLPSNSSRVSIYGTSVPPKNRGLLYGIIGERKPSLQMSSRATIEDEWFPRSELTHLFIGESDSITSNVLGGQSDQRSLNNARLFYDNTSSLEELQSDEIVELAKQHEGSKYLQGILMEGQVATREKIFNALLGSMFEIMIDQFENHLFQRLLELCNEYELQRIAIKVIREHHILKEVACYQYGSRAVKKLIKTVKKSPLSGILTTALSFGVLRLMLNAIGNNVIRYCFTHLDPKQNEFLFRAMVNHCVVLATYEQGCLSLNDCINYIVEPYRSDLLNKIMQHCVYLSHDPYGNYVVQHVLGLQHPLFTQRMCLKLYGSYVRLSMQKYGSHVVEKCINSSGMKYVISEFVEGGNLKDVVQDRFGNYVVQSALKATKARCSLLYQILVNAIRPLLPNLEYHPNGRNVFNLINNGGMN